MSRPRSLWLLALTLCLGLVTAGPAVARSEHSSHQSGRHGWHHSPAVAVDGAVSAPASYTRDQLAALPQVTLTDQRSPFWSGHTLTGVPLAALVAASGPSYDAGKNPQLRATVDVKGPFGQDVAVALGELDPSFGNHPALLVLAVDGHALPGSPVLAFPGDDGFSRTVLAVDELTVSVTAPSPPTVQPGSLQVACGSRVVTLTGTQLDALPQMTRTVTFLAGTASQTHTEVGPDLAGVLRAAHLRTGPATTVTAVGSDAYAATVTPAEARAGRRPLMLSLTEDGVPLTQPRLVADGDLKGGRDVSGTVLLSVTGCR